MVHLFETICNFCLDHKRCRYVVIPIPAPIRMYEEVDFPKNLSKFIEGTKDRIKIAVCLDCVPASSSTFELVVE